MNFKFIYLIFLSSKIKILSNKYCRFGESCLNNCNNCGEDNDYSNCNYYNLFCDTNSGIKYFENYENNYIQYFSNNNDLNYICGNSNIIIKTKEKTKNFELINTNNEETQQFLKKENLHCFYEFENSYFKDNNIKLSLIINHKNSNSSNNNKSDSINFMIIIMLYSSTNSANIFDLKKNSLKDNTEIIELKYYSRFTIFIDIDSNENIKESITVTLNYKNNKKFSPIYILLIILGGLIFIILIILFISIIKSKLKKEQRARRNGNTERHSTEELEKNIKIQKIKQLFKTEFLPQYYSKKLDEKGFNGCTICIKKYKNNLSKIVILSCNHIFHYKCLYDWLINNKHWKCPICNLDLTEKVKLVSRSNKNSEDQINIQKLNLNNGMVVQTSNELISVNVHTND